MKFLKYVLLSAAFLLLGLGAGQAYRYVADRLAAGPSIKHVDLKALGYSVANKPVVISLSTCPVCQRASRWLAENKIEHVELVVDKSDDARRMATALGVSAVPVFLIGEQQITGFDPQMLARLLKEQRHGG